MTTPPDRPFDVGLQTERTALAWQRTSLSFAVASLVGARLLLERLSVASYVFVTLALVLTAVIFLIGHRRYLLVHRRLMNGSGYRISPASALPLFLWAAAALGLALAGLVVTLMVPG